MIFCVFSWGGGGEGGSKKPSRAEKLALFMVNVSQNI